MRRAVLWVSRKTTVQQTRPPQTCLASQLPADVLLLVFSQLDYGDRVSTTHVCSHWRYASLAFPSELWSYVATKGRARSFYAQLERAGNVPLTISIHCTTRHSYLLRDALKALAPRMSHVRHLAITLERRHTRIKSLEKYEPSVTVLMGFLRQTEAPILQALALCIRPDHWSQEVDSVALPQDLFRGSAPQLRTLMLKGQYHLPEMCPAISNIVNLSLSLKANQTIGDLTFRRLRMFLRLENLCLDRTDMAYIDGGPHPGLPLHVRTLRIVGEGQGLRHRVSLTSPASIWKQYSRGIFADVVPPTSSGSNFAYVAVHAGSNDWAGSMIID